MPLLTVGHGTLAQDGLVELLVGAGVELVVDVRSYPGSRRHPQFGREAMEEWLPAAGVAYTWERRLGGRRPPRPDSPHVALRHDGFRGYADHMATEPFGHALAAVLAEERTSAVLCSESLWSRCHRQLLADAAVLLRGVEVVHLLHDGGRVPHTPTDGVRVEGDRLVYDVGAEVPML